MKIEGSIALVTGANRGLGRALVAALVEAGAAKVYAAARDEKALGAPGGRVVPVTLDTTKPDQVAAAALKASDVTLLINNAGTLSSFNVMTTSPQALDADFQTNVHGTLAVIKAFVPVLARAPGGATIVNVLSMAALASVPGMGGYSASKSAAYSITQALRPELKAKGIELLAALPGPIDTDMVKMMPMPKTSPGVTAAGVLAGIARGEEEIFPDPMAQQMSVLWNKSHKELERVFAGF
ncbi:MAG TPA: SDR family NAD(P)-dependent oxidoreductase [Polyangia bacterium]|nr:SDR family NAD(P)-dependent oxidoreductase [Polyangia bacterium]